MTPLTTTPVNLLGPAKIVFIDRRTYAALTSRGEDLLQVALGIQGTRHAALSLLTDGLLRHLNERILGGLFGETAGLNPPQWRTDAEYQYLQDFYETEYLQEYLGVEKYFEILPLSSAIYLVVVEKGFVHHVTSSKAALRSFLMTCLYEQVKFGCDTTQLHKTYLNLQLNSGYEQLLWLRLS